MSVQTADSIDDFMENPTKFGMPTFEEFVRNKEKYLGRYDEELEGIERGDHNLQCKQRYFMHGVELDSLEQAERIAREEGLSIHRDYVVKPQVRHAPDLRRGYYLEVTFMPKAEAERRARW